MAMPEDKPQRNIYVAMREYLSDDDVVFMYGFLGAPNNSNYVKTLETVQNDLFGETCRRFLQIARREQRANSFLPTFIKDVAYLVALDCIRYGVSKACDSQILQQWGLGLWQQIFKQRTSWKKGAVEQGLEMPLQEGDVSDTLNFEISSEGVKAVEAYGQRTRVVGQFKRALNSA